MTAICTDIDGLVEEMNFPGIKEVKSNIVVDNITGEKVVEYVIYRD